jgi:sporulation protein YlmC with PRC-barrel domain
VILVSAESFRGKKVIGIKGLLIGEVEGLDIDIDTWRATHIRIHLTDDVAKQLGYRTGGLINIRSNPIISLPVEAIDQVGDVVTIKDSFKELKDLELKPATM